MKKHSVLVLFVLSLAVIVLPSQAFAFLGLEAGVGYWQQTPSGTLDYKGTSLTDNLDLKSDLNYEKKSNPFVRIKAELPLILPNIYIMATPMSFDGTGTKNVSFNYGGQTFSANTAIQSKVKLDHYDLAFFYPIPLLKPATVGVLNAELGLNIRKIDFQGTISQDTLSLSASKSLSLYVPMIYVGVQVKPTSTFSVEIEGRGIAYGANHYYDYMGKLKIMPIGPLYVSGGYRAETIKIDQSDVKCDIKFAGPFVEAGLFF